MGLCLELPLLRPWAPYASFPRVRNQFPRQPYPHASGFTPVTSSLPRCAGFSPARGHTAGMGTMDGYPVVSPSPMLWVAQSMEMDSSPSSRPGAGAPGVRLGSPRGCEGASALPHVAGRQLSLSRGVPTAGTDSPSDKDNSHTGLGPHLNQLHLQQSFSKWGHIVKDEGLGLEHLSLGDISHP